jgi:transketolase
MGLAELGALLYGEVLKHHPGDSSWPDRDRFVLSGGHGSMLLYSLLHLSGYNLSLDEIKSFRQVGSRTPGHPEYGHTEGVETTTGPLGQGISTAVGMAIAEQWLAARYNTDRHVVVDHYTYVIASDGDLMEGVASEACSLAGHQKLGKLIVFYDDNHVSIDGPTEITFTEDRVKRFEAYGWHVQSGDAYDVEGLRHMIAEAQAEDARPSFIALRSIIGKGAPNMAGTSAVHGSPLGEEELALAKKEIGLDPEKRFFIDPEAERFFTAHKAALNETYEQWTKTFEEWGRANPELKARWDAGQGADSALIDSIELPSFELGDKVPTRKAGGAVMQAIGAAVPHLIGGSADLASSNNNRIKEGGDFGPQDRSGRNIAFGVREHAMGAAVNGITLHGGLRGYGATFLIFSDYQRPAVRLAALMGCPSIFLYTHDSVYLGEDGPTHQPIEHFAALRAIPNLEFIRPADAEETGIAWKLALARREGPTAIALSRQGLPVLEKADPAWRESMGHGAYVVSDVEGSPDVILVATGSEVSLAVKAAGQSKKRVRVISMPSVDRFRAAPKDTQARILPAGIRTVVAEAGVGLGWEAIASSSQDLFVIERFGASGPGESVAEYLGYTVEALTAMLDRELS